jgi:hypothetical protein
VGVVCVAVDGETELGRNPFKKRHLELYDMEARELAKVYSVCQAVCARIGRSLGLDMTSSMLSSLSMT